MKRYFLIAAIIFSGVFVIASAVSAAYSGMNESQSQGSYNNQGGGISSGRNCDGNAVIRCGSLSDTEFRNGYRQSGVAAIYSYFGITARDIGSTWGHAQYGTVTKNGKVIVDGGVVATNAVTAGRQYMPGSQKVSSGGATFYVRRPNVSFRSQSLPAEVMMRNGRFVYAIIISCGNPVMATPVRQAKPKTAPQTSAAPPATQSQIQTQTQSVTVNTTVNTPQPAAPQVAAATTSAPAASPAPAASLPNTGPGDVLKISGMASVFGSVGHFIYARRRRY